VKVRFISPESLLARLLIQKDQSNLVLLTGPCDAGKTSRCLELAEEGRRQRLSLGGLISPPVLINGIKLSIDLLDVASGERRRLAYHRRFYQKGGVAGESTLPTGNVLSTDAWHFNPDVLAWGNAILEQSEDCDLYFLDEIGPLEFNHGQGFQAGFRHLDARCHRLSVVVVRPALIPRAIERWPWAKIFPLTSSREINRS
jgi:nucleoside-triphosphatase THEP1